MKNKYFIRSRVSEAKFREIIKLFSGDLTACQIALFSGVSRMCVNRILKQVRIRITEFCEQESIFKNGEIEIDESYFGARRVRGREEEALMAKPSCLVLNKEMAKFILKLLKIALKRSLFPLSIKEYPDQPLFIQMVLKLMMAW